MPFIGEAKDEELIKQAMNFRHIGNLLHHQSNGYFDNLQRFIFANPKHSPQEVINAFREDAPDMLKWLQAHADARTRYHGVLMSVAPAGFKIEVKENSVTITGSPIQTESTGGSAGVGIGRRLSVKPAKQPLSEEELQKLKQPDKEAE